MSRLQSQNQHQHQVQTIPKVNKNDDNNNYLIAFDFDQTLSVNRVYRQPSSLSEYIELFGGEKRINLLSNLLSLLKESNIKIIIISWNSERIIKDTLKTINIYKYFDNIYDQWEMVKKGGFNHGKAKIIRSLNKKLNINKNNCIMVDDCKKVLQFCTDFCHIIHVQHKKGITINEINQITKLFNLSNQFHMENGL
eukprot:277958_1